MAEPGGVEERLVETVLSALDALVVVLAPDGRVVLFNRACERLTGFDASDIRGRTLWESLLPPEEVEPVKAVLRDLTERAVAGRHRNVWLTRSGERRLIEWSNTAVTAADGAVEFVIGTGTDVTERARMSRRLEADEARLRAIAETCPDAIVTIDEHGLIGSFSAAAEKMFGRREAEVLGRNVSMLMPEPYRAQHDGYLARYRETGERRIIGIGRLVSGRRRDGSTFPLELAVGEARGRDGRLFVGFLHDLTARQHALRRVQELQAELAQAARLTAAEGLASAIAHELIQPLTANATYLQACRTLIERAGGEAMPARALELLDKAAAQSLRAGEIVRHMRQLVARGEADRRAESINRVVEEAVSLVMVGAEDTGVKLALELADGLPPVLIDRLQVQQVVVNLARNAIESMADSARRELVITTERARPDRVAVKVRDTGPGLDEAARARLFQPFATTKAAGLGLGLAISRSIVESHDSQLTAAADPAGGTVFSFTLPAAAEPGDGG